MTTSTARANRRLTRAERDAQNILLLKDPNTPFETKMKIVRAKQKAMQRQLFDRFVPLGNMPLDEDTYKRWMAAGDEEFALLPASYSLTFRKALPEPGADDRLIMAGHELMLSQVYRKPMKRVDIEIMRFFMKNVSNVKAFPDKFWDTIMAGQGENIRWPVDVWGFPGGQTFLKGVPVLSVEGIGAAASYPEDPFDRYYVPVSQATKSRLMGEAAVNNAEFGLRSAPHADLATALSLYRYVGSGGKTKLTSNDMAHFVWTLYTLACGTVGHEQVSSKQRFDRTLQFAQQLAMRAMLEGMGGATLLLDLIDTLSVGMEDFLKMLDEYPDARIGGRVDSGNIKKQCVILDRATRQKGHPDEPIVFEDEVTPDMVKVVLAFIEEKTGFKPDRFIPGAGGYYYKIHRDNVSAKYARTATDGHPNIKFGNAGEDGSQESTMVSGKQTIPGTTRVYGRGDTLIRADASENIDGEPLYVPLVKQGRICYREWCDFEAQAARTNRTWDRYKRVENSPLVADYVRRFTEMRKNEIAAARARLEAGGLNFDID